MNRFFTLALCGAASIVMATTADAQIVRWGPGGGVRVRAPFVAVDVLPYGGGTSVRAPFAAVDSRYYSYRPGVAVGPVPPLPIYPLPAYPHVDRRAIYPRVIYPGAVFPGVVYPGVYAPVVAPGVVYPDPRAQVDLSARSEVYQSGRSEIPVAVPDRLRASAEALAKTLTVRQDGDVWLNYLEPQRIIETIDLRRSPATLKDLVANYDGVVGNSSLGMIREARGFRETHELLHAFLETPETPQAEAPQAETPPAETGSADPARPAESLPLPPPAESPTAKPSDSPAEPSAVPTPPSPTPPSPTPPTPEPPTPRPPQTAKPTSL